VFDENKRLNKNLFEKTKYKLRYFKRHDVHTNNNNNSKKFKIFFFFGFMLFYIRSIHRI
jgi:hypothetical protein